MQKGKVIAIQGPIVIVRLDSPHVLPAIYDILETKTYNGQRVVLEVVEYLGRRDTDIGNIVKCIPLTPIFGLQRNAQVLATGSMIKTPVGKGVCSRRSGSKA